MHSGVVQGCSLRKEDDAYLGLCVTGWLHDIIDGIKMSCQGNTACVNKNAIVMVTTVSARGAILTAATYRMQPASVFTM